MYVMGFLDEKRKFKVVFLSLCVKFLIGRFLFFRLFGNFMVFDFFVILDDIFFRELSCLCSVGFV